jgi:oxygen-independent coproporphyrinogen-3 oxidase
MLETPDPVRHLYIHIPFCPAKCSYCAFATHIGSLKLAPAYLRALDLEMARVAASGRTDSLETVYFGGGTPSMLSATQIAGILATVSSNFCLSPSAEVTLEAHPATVDERKLKEVRAAGVTRISFGAESFDDQLLAAIGRTHSASDVRRVVPQAREAGFESIALDLIYGLPGHTPRSWEHSLRSAIESGVDHLSLYPLSVEPKTVLAHRQKRGRLSLPPDDSVVEMYQHACQALRDAGYEHYEVASWCRPGWRCRHNLANWLGRQYYGVGVAAHAYLRPFRTENVTSVSRYLRRLADGASPVVHAEHIGRATEVVEAVMLGLRLLTDGLDLVAIRERFGVDIAAKMRPEIEELSDAGLIVADGSSIRLCESAVPVGNDVWARLAPSHPDLQRVM